MKIVKRLLLGLLIIIALVLVVALFLPKEMHVEREISINRPKAMVFAYIKMVRNQDNYSVWNQKDPNAKKTATGVDGTPGFIYAWDGNKDIGKGEQEIKKITEGERVDMELRFERPWKSTAGAYMTTVSEGENQTKVTWGFEGSSPWPFNIMSVMMKSKLGDQLQTGLNNLKNNLEKM